MVARVDPSMGRGLEGSHATAAPSTASTHALLACRRESSSFSLTILLQTIAAPTGIARSERNDLHRS